MPKLDGTGPQGQGPMTGRGMGKCAGAQPLYYGLGQGRRMGANRGRKIGLGRLGWFGAGLDKVDQKEVLKEEKDALKKELELVEKELKDLEKE